ncbi:MAG TPA: response regulator [Longimicrobiales bacterium]
MAWRILLVDDDADIRGAVSTHLRQRGAVVAEADTARPALACLEADRFDLLITDVRMPGPSGLWLLSQVRRRWARLPVILITGWVPDSNELEIYRTADAVLLKPFRLFELTRRIERILGRGDETGPDANGAPSTTPA